MTITPHASTIAVAKLPFDQLIPHLRSAGKYPLRITCIGIATFIDDDQDAEPISFDHTLHLAQCDSLDGAIAEAARHMAFDDLGPGGNDAWTFSPRLIVIQDADGCLAAAGEVDTGAIRWCEPVASDGEARKIVTEASRLRGRAFAEAGLNNRGAARHLHFSASVLEGRLVDSFWRAPARAALIHTPNSSPAVAPGVFISGA
ncbi:hypothetical protein [Mesorhizobium retamae]|uniref:Uncharacterized protein n=1 Tax=Mesorhizobium retamae TaxID=2912854 RepID=A0ABS9QEJ3_9HYPH|nr:hypothetical protein [Mesorhizobium sp. IRAMC:0171]MCG7505834.1 hypothetical protein [Mesorhizobium sp. IRAMC:0171]